MDFEGILKLVAEKFSKEHIRFALIGGLALHAAGYRRSTGDLDFLIHRDDTEKTKTILVPLGYRVLHESDDILNLASPWQLTGGIDFIKAHRRYALAMLERAKPLSILQSVNIPVAAFEDVIGLKVQAMSNDVTRAAGDLADIEWLIRNHQDRLDMKLIREYFVLFSCEEDLNRILTRVKHAE